MLIVTVLASTIQSITLPSGGQNAAWDENCARLLVITAGLIVLTAGQSQAAMYQVSMQGSDSNDGVTAPWKSLQRGSMHSRHAIP